MQTRAESRQEKRAVGLFLILLIFGFSFYFLVGARFSETMLNQFGPYNHQSVRYLKERIAKTNWTRATEDVLVLGDSTASRNLIWSGWADLRTRSLNVMGGSLIEPTLLLRKYLKQNPAPRCVLIMTSYGALKSHYEVYFWGALVRYGLYSVTDLSDLYERSRKNGEYPGAMMGRFEFWENILFRYNALWFDAGFLQDAIWNPKTLLTAERSYRLLSRNQGATPLTTAQAIALKTKFFGDNHGFFESDFVESKTLDSYIRELLEVLEVAKIKSIFFIPPMAFSARSPESEKWIRQYQAHMNEMLKDFPNTKAMLEPKWLEDSRFIDINHLNEASAKQYSSGLRGDVDACIARTEQP